MSAEQEIISNVLERISSWEHDSATFFSLWEEWSSAYRMVPNKSDRRPSGVSKNITAETPRAANALASVITRMQTAGDPYFELRSTGATEDELFPVQKRYQDMLTNLEFKRKLLKGNRSMCLFGTQVWEEPYVQFPTGTSSPLFEGTDFKPLSLLQVAFDTTVYDMKDSDYLATLNRMSGNMLRFMANAGNGFSRSGVWNLEKLEEGIKEKSVSGDSGFSNSSIEFRRQVSGYQDVNNRQNELILWHGRLQDQDKNDVLNQMWKKFGREDDIRFSDITIGILNRKHLVRLHPTPYGTWHHMFKIGHYIEFELEPYGFGVGKLGGELQKWQNQIMRYANDVAKFSLWNLFLAGRGAGLKSQNMNVFPWAVLQVDDIGQIRELRPQIEGITNGLKLNEIMRDDFRGVTHATTTLQAEVTGGTATEASLTHSEALRAVGVIAEVESDSVIRPHFRTMHRNDIDQNPFDTSIPRELEFIPKVTTDKDFKPEHIKMLVDLLTLTSSIRQEMPLDLNIVPPILKKIMREAGIDPRELKEPRPQIDRTLDILKRINSDSDLQREVLGEEQGLRNEIPHASGVPANPAVPNSPLGVV